MNTSPSTEWAMLVDDNGEDSTWRVREERREEKKRKGKGKGGEVEMGNGESGRGEVNKTERALHWLSRGQRRSVICSCLILGERVCTKGDRGQDQRRNAGQSADLRKSDARR